MGKLTLLLSVELFVLIAAIFLLVYIIKQQVSKWFKYGASAIIIAVLVLMIGSVCCSICCRKYCGAKQVENECSMDEMRCNKMMMFKMKGGGCPEEMMMHEGMMGGGKCCKSEESCEVKKECCKKEEECEIKKDDCCKKKEGMKNESVIDTISKKNMMKK